MLNPDVNSGIVTPLDGTARMAFIQRPRMSIWFAMRVLGGVFPDIFESQARLMWTAHYRLVRKYAAQRISR